MLTVYDLMGEICDWLRANDIEPTDVPTDAVPDLTVEGVITCPVYLRNAEGHKYLVGDDVARGSITVPLKVRPPAALHGWLAGLVPAP